MYLLVMKKLGSHITYDSHNDFWTVTKGDITVIFREEKQWLPCIDLEDEDQGVVLSKLCMKATKVTPSKSSRKL